MKKIGCIGIGNMGGALLSAICTALPNEDIQVCDTNPTKVAYYTQKYHCHNVSAAHLAADADYILLGVKPQGMKALLESLASAFLSRAEKPTLISMAAGITMEQVRNWSGTLCPVIRIMPNIAVSAGEGMLIYDHTPDVSAETLADFRTMFSTAGKLLPLAENRIDAASAISGCGPAFVCLFAEALADGGVACGLSRNDAYTLVMQTLLGTAKLLAESDKHPGAWKDAITSPAGTTIAGIRTLEQNGFRSAAMEAVIASYMRTLDLQK